MAYECAICGKHTRVGKSQQHRRGVAGKRWKNRVTPTPRLFKPNLQVFSYEENGKTIKAKLCTKCIKRIKKDKADSFATL